jgi:serine/threonine protein kinase
MSDDAITKLGEILPNRFLERFKIIRSIGRGSMGEVFLAEDTQLSRQVAIKTVRAAGELAPDLEANLQNRFKKEADASARISHPNVITIFDYAIEDGTQYIVMEYVDGRPLSKIIASDDSIGIQDVFRILSSICAGVKAIHRSGTIHRDLKPSNIMCGKQEGVIKIMDLGIARMEGSDMTRIGAIIGTLNYMSPEQAQGRQVTRASDIFSIGCIAYELITREKAFPGRTPTSVLYRIANEEPIKPSKIDPTLAKYWDTFVDRCLEKGPEERFKDCDEVLAFLAKHDPAGEEGESKEKNIWGEAQQAGRAEALEHATDSAVDTPWMTGEVFWISSILTLGMSTLTIPYIILRNFVAALSEQSKKGEDLKLPDTSKSLSGWGLYQIFASWGLSALGVISCIVFALLMTNIDFASVSAFKASTQNAKIWLFISEFTLFSGWILLLLWHYRISQYLDRSLATIRTPHSEENVRERSRMFGKIYYVILEGGVVMIAIAINISGMFDYQVEQYWRRLTGGPVWSFDAFYLLELSLMPIVAILLVYIAQGYVRYVTRILLDHFRD